MYQDDVTLDVEATEVAKVWATLKSQLAQDGWEVQPAKCCGHVPSGAPVPDWPEDLPRDDPELPIMANALDG
eukprot:5863442-Alexandrium_andersonii.AAC.1